MKRYTRTTAPPDRLNYAQWRSVCISHLDADTQARFARLRNAVTRYIGGDKTQSIEDDEGVCREQLMRAFNRCITLDAERRIVGWLGLVGGVRLRAPLRVKAFSPSGRNGKSGFSGACAVFMHDHPQLKADFDRYLLDTATRQPEHENKVRHGPAYAKFIKLCELYRVPEQKWPFNTDKRGRNAIYDYVNRFLTNHADAIITTQYGRKAKTQSATGTGVFTRLHAAQFLDVVELDEYLCDFKGWIAFETPGGRRWIKSPRLSLIAMVDRASGLVIAVKVIFRSQARAHDILDVLHHACVGGGLPADAGDASPTPAMPADLGLPFTWCSFNQLLVDNALAHLADEIHERARDFLGCDLNLGPIRRPDRRPNIEGLFSALARFGFHRLQETTGSGPQDPLRIEPPPTSERQMSEAKALVLIYRSVRFHNRGYAKGAYGVRKIEQLHGQLADAEQGMIFPQLPPLLEHMPRLDVSVLRLKVQGGKETGRRSHLYLKEESYVGVELSDRWDLAGEYVIAHLDRRDARYLRLFTEQGASLGTATVTGRWRHHPHTLDQRIHLNKLIRDGQLRVRYDEDPIAAHLADIANAACHRPDLTAEQTRAVAAHAEYQHAQEQHAQAVAQQSMEAALNAARTPPPRHAAMPELRAFSGRRR